MTTTTALDRRLRPLQISMFLQGFCLWLPVEKLFLTEIGFDAALVGVMAASYAVVVPVMEVPSGVLADRWSRRGVLMLAILALFASVTVGALSTNVPTYLVCAGILGVYFAMQSGTVEAIVYDTLLEDLGDSEQFERRYGRTQLVHSVALTVGCIVGGVLASRTEPRMTYVASLPAYALAVLALFWLREPRLHRDDPRSAQAGAAPSFGAQLSLTLRTVSRQPHLLPVVAVLASSGVAFQVLIEFGPLWLVAFGTTAAVFGPYSAAITATFGLGGALAGRVRFEDPVHLGSAVALMSASCLTLVVSNSTVAVVVAQVALCATLVLVGIYLRRVLHDGIPSTIRAGVASGVGSVTSLVFLPCALVCGVIMDRFGTAAGGLLVAALCAVTAVVLIAMSVRSSQLHGSAADEPCVAVISDG
jgi:MFS family permease